MVGQQCCAGDHIIFDRSINNSIDSAWAVGAMRQIGAAGALQAGRPAQGEVPSTKLKLHLVVERLPVQTKVTFCCVDLICVREGNYAGPPALRSDFSANGQRALIGCD